MTQTLTRELKQKIKEVLIGYSFVEFTGETLDKAVDEIADAVRSVAGIKSKIEKFSDPVWDLLHGKAPSMTEALSLEAMYKVTAERLEIGLRRNEFPQTPAAQSVYRWIAEQEAKGESLDTWMEWAMEGKRAQYSFTYHSDPRLIKRDWPQAFSRRSSVSGDVERDANDVPMSW